MGGQHTGIVQWCCSLRPAWARGCDSPGNSGTPRQESCHRSVKRRGTDYAETPIQGCDPGNGEKCHPGNPSRQPVESTENRAGTEDQLSGPDLQNPGCRPGFPARGSATDPKRGANRPRPELTSTLIEKISPSHSPLPESAIFSRE